MVNYQTGDSKLRNRVREVRLSLGLFQADLQRRSGLARRTIRLIEQEDQASWPSSRAMVAISVALGRQLGDLFWIEPDPAAAGEQSQT